MNYFKPSDFNITGQPIPEDVADKIHLFHIIPLNKAREAFGQAIMISKKSGYRPRWWELKKNRNGSSQHTFLGRGAVDITCLDFDTHKWKLLTALVNQTEYTRITLYESARFIHCDYAALERYVYNDKWEKMWPAEKGKIQLA